MPKPEPCGKVRYYSRAEATIALLALPMHANGGVYRCYKRGCKSAWHVTSHAGEGWGRGRRKR